jgi:hypothetical protein
MSKRYAAQLTPTTMASGGRRVLPNSRCAPRWAAVDDPNHVMVDLDFDTSDEAQAFLAAMRARVGRVQGRIMSNPQARIGRAVETKEYRGRHGGTGPAHRRPVAAMQRERSRVDCGDPIEEER